MEGCGLLHGRIWFVFMSGRVWFMTVVLRIPIAHNVCALIKIHSFPPG